MASFADLSANLNLNIQNFSNSLRRAATQASSFASGLNNGVGNSLTDIDKKTTAWGMNMKSISRVVSGILISQAFYGMLQNIKQATSAVWEYAKQLEYAHMAYSNLFNGSALSSEFINVMEDFAARTPFDFTDVEQAARRLLAYGIDYKNVMYVAQGVLSGSAMTGDPATIERVSRAIGQIYSKGKVYQEEVRQLTEANIPAMEILREKLQLTEDDISNIGRAAIPASVAINALIDGMNERFGSVLDASSMTIVGIFSNIRDNAKMLGNVVFDPLIQKIKEVGANFGNWLKVVRDVATTKGTGGVLEHLFPPEAQDTIRIFTANIMALAGTVRDILSGAFKIFGTVLGTVIDAFNALAPVINIIASLLSSLISWIANSTGSLRVLTSILLGCAAAWVIFKLQALGALVISAVAGVINAVSTAVLFLSTVLSTSPVIALLGVLAAVAITVALSFDKARAALKNFTSELLKVTGIDPKSILIPSQKDRAAELSKFSNRLDDSADSMGDLGDAAADAAKKAKKAQAQLLAFDEVFRLNKEDTSDLDTGVYRVPISLATGGDGTAQLPLLDDLLPDGIDVGSVPEITSENFITEFIDRLKQKMIDAGIGSVIGGAIGFALRGPGGAKLGAAIGAIGGIVWSYIADALELSDVTRIAAPIATGIGTALAMAFGGLRAGPIGAAIGVLATGLISGIAEGIQTGDWSKLTTPLTTSIGAAIGFALGGIPGALAGSGIGLALGSVLTPYTNQIVDGLYAFGGQVYDFFYNLGGNAYTALSNAKANLSTWLIDTAASLAFWSISTKLTIDTWVTDVRTAISEWATNTRMAIQAWSIGAITDVATWAITAAFNIRQWVETTKQNIVSWAATTLAKIGSWATNAGSRIRTFTDNALAAISTFVQTALSSIGAWAASMISNASSAMSSFTSSIRSGLGNAMAAVRSFCSQALSAIGSWARSVASTVANALSSAAKSVGNFASSAYSKAKTTVTSWLGGGHATGGIFNREHVARFAEGNKAEAVIPLENASAMQPFVDAISRGLTSSLAPMLATAGNTSYTSSEDRRPLYVGTLIADERSLKELERKMQIIRVQEERRGQ